MVKAAENLAYHAPPQDETLVRALLDPRRPKIRRLRVRQQAGRLLAADDSLRLVGNLTPEERRRLVNRVDQVRRPGYRSFSAASVHAAFIKAYLTADIQNVQFLISFGELCSAAKQLPASAIIPTGLTKHGDTSVASGGMTDVWRGEYQGTQVAIKAFRTYSPQNLEEAMEVRVECARDAPL
jgi:hypothetical protein